MSKPTKKEIIKIAEFKDFLSAREKVIFIEGFKTGWDLAAETIPKKQTKQEQADRKYLNKIVSILKKEQILIKLKP